MVALGSSESTHLWSWLVCTPSLPHESSQILTHCNRTCHVRARFVPSPGVTSRFSRTPPTRSDYHLCSRVAIAPRRHIRYGGTLCYDCRVVLGDQPDGARDVLVPCLGARCGANVPKEFGSMVQKDFKWLGPYPAHYMLLTPSSGPLHT